MPDTTDRLQDLRRPRLLVRAARFGLSDYDRDRDLRRVFGPGATPAPGRAVGRLLDQEAGLEAIRLAGGAGYSVARHVQVLTALMAESSMASERVS
jgi:hypothetical protein